MDSDLTTGETHYTYSTSYSRTVTTSVITTDENGVLNTQQSTVTTNSSNPPSSTTFTTVEHAAERKNQKIAWLICLVALFAMTIFITGSLFFMFRVSLFWGMAVLSVGTIVLPIILVSIRHKLGYRTRGGFRIGGFAIVDKSRTVHPPPPPQARAMSRTSVISNQAHTHAPPLVGISNVNQNFGASQFQTQTNYPYASTTQGYQGETKHSGYETQQANVWAQPVGYQGYSQQPSHAGYPPPPPGGPYADPPPSYESTTR